VSHWYFINYLVDVMKIDSLFRIKNIQLNQLDEECNDLLAEADDIEQEIRIKFDQMEELRTQLELYDPNYKTEMEKIEWISVKKYQEREEEIPF